MSCPFAGVSWSPTFTANHAAPVGAAAVTDRVLISPAANATSAESSSAWEHAAPPVWYQRIPMNMLFLVAGQYTSAFADTMSPTDTGCPLVPVGELAAGFADPLHVRSSECVSVGGHAW